MHGPGDVDCGTLKTKATRGGAARTRVVRYFVFVVVLAVSRVMVLAGASVAAERLDLLVAPRWRSRGRGSIPYAFARFKRISAPGADELQGTAEPAACRPPYLVVSGGLPTRGQELCAFRRGKIRLQNILSQHPLISGPVIRHLSGQVTALVAARRPGELKCRGSVCAWRSGMAAIAMPRQRGVG